jgi:hypothetical protein
MKMAKQQTQVNYDSLFNARCDQEATAKLVLPTGETIMVNLSPRVMGKDGQMVDEQYTNFSFWLNLPNSGMKGNYGDAARKQLKQLHEVALAQGIDEIEFTFKGKLHIKKESVELATTEVTELDKLAYKLGISTTTNGSTTGSKKEVNDAIAKLIKRK